MTEHVRGDWTVLRDGGSMIAQGYKCSCGVIGCQQSQPMTEPQIPADVQAQLEMIALAYHKANRPDGEGEYGCPGVECPGVKRLIRPLDAAYRLGLSQREALEQAAVDAEAVAWFQRLYLPPVGVLSVGNEGYWSEVFARWLRARAAALTEAERRTINDLG